MNQFIQKVVELTDTFDPMPTGEYKKEWTEGEHAWIVRKRVQAVAVSPGCGQLQDV
jgi:hypothetical protein